MKPITHAAASAVVSVAIYTYYRSPSCALIAFCAGFLIDIDHFFDFYMNYGFTLNVRRIHMTMRAADIKKIYVLLHAYEFIIILWAAIIAFGLGPYWVSLAIGLTQHMIIDQIGNGFYPLGYFLTYRALVSFNRDLILRKKGCCS